VKRDLGALSTREFDVVVVGGGIHGAAAAWDAAQRGLATALVEAEDFGAGVSWNSLKTIHGGLRYLQSLDLRRMRESIRERSTLLRIAPGIVRPLPFVVPTYGHGPKGREALALALLVNDVVSAGRNRDLPPEHRIPRGRSLSPSEVRALFPGVSERGLTGAALWTDAQVTSSERLTVGFVRAAAEAGAVVANHAEVVGLASSKGRIAGAQVRDRLDRDGGRIEVRARVVLNAAGPAMDAVLGFAGVRRPPVPLLGAYNLVLRRAIVTTHALGAASRGRFLFAVPWQGRSIVGTDYGPPDLATERAAAAFLDEIGEAFPWAGIAADDVAVVHQGRVPGSGGAQGLATRHLLLDHEKADGLPGLVSMQGVKYTTARGVAEEAVDVVARRIGKTTAPCRTAATPLVHARPLPGSLEARAVAAAREEMALTLQDAVLRRLDLGTAAPPAPEDRDLVAAVLAREHGWTSERQAREVDALDAAYVKLGRESG
jgi:glycerol-3-phosphate dehydrogenase